MDNYHRRRVHQLYPRHPRSCPLHTRPTRGLKWSLTVSSPRAPSRHFGRVFLVPETNAQRECKYCTVARCSPEPSCQSSKLSERTTRPRAEKSSKQQTGSLGVLRAVQKTGVYETRVVTESDQAIASL